MTAAVEERKPPGPPVALARALLRRNFTLYEPEIEIAWRVVQRGTCTAREREKLERIHARIFGRELVAAP